MTFGLANYIGSATIKNSTKPLAAPFHLSPKPSEKIEKTPRLVIDYGEAQR